MSDTPNTPTTPTPAPSTPTVEVSGEQEASPVKRKLIPYGRPIPQAELEVP